MQPKKTSHEELSAEIAAQLIYNNEEAANRATKLRRE
jgi:hypothetical protein